MNRKYYAAIYLDRNPTPIDMSLLDTKEVIKNEKKYTKTVLFESDSLQQVETIDGKKAQIVKIRLSEKFLNKEDEEKWLKIEVTIKSDLGYENTSLHSSLISPGNFKENKIRLLNGITKYGEYNNYSFYIRIPKYIRKGEFQLSLISESQFKGTFKLLKIISLRK